MKISFIFVCCIIFVKQCDGYKMKKVLVKPKGNGKPLSKADIQAVAPSTDGDPELVGPAEANVGKSKIRPLIIGGSEAEKSQFPWQAALFLDKNSFCGGSLIARSIILTAAHCTDMITLFEISLGIISLEDTENRVFMTATKRVQHQRYDRLTLKNDIAIIKLPVPVTAVQMSSGRVGMIRLPSVFDAKRKSYIGVKATISGWGKTDDTSDVSDSLKYVTLTVISNAACAAVYGREYIYSTNLCTYENATEAALNICQGDSGGPLQIQEIDGRNSRHTQIGIVSFGSSESCFKDPAGYTRVTSYLAWISRNAKIPIRWI